MTYKELLLHLKALDPNVKSVELFLRKYFTDTGVGADYLPLIAQSLTAGLLSLNPDATAPTAPSQGDMWWDADEETVSLKQNGAILQVGQEVHYHARNNTGADIPDGTPIMASGTLGNSGRITIAPMDASSVDNAKYFMGIATEVIEDDTDGKVTHFGKIRGIDTTGSGLTTPEVWADGDLLYPNPSQAGELTKTKPAAPALALPVAIVIKAHSSGTLFVRATQTNENFTQTSLASPVCE